MSKITLQRGVETTLRHYVPEVKSIVGQDDEEAEGQGYEPYFPKDKEPADLTLEECLSIAENAPPKRAKGNKNNNKS